MKEEVLHDLARFLADAGELEEGTRYFMEASRQDLVVELQLRLAEGYRDQGKFEQATGIYRRLIVVDPNSPRAPEYQNEIIKALMKLGNLQGVVDSVFKLVETYRPGTAWYTANTPEARQQAMTAMEEGLRALAINLHMEARKLRTGPEAAARRELAEKVYRLYFELFADSSNAYEMRYAFAELLYSSKKYSEAYEHYMQVVAMNPQGAHSKFCAESAIFAAEQVVKNEAGDNAKISPDEERALLAWKQFVALYPDDEKTQRVLYKLGYFYYEYQQLEEMAEWLMQAITANPQSKEAVQAARMILAAYTKAGDWKTVRKYAKTFYRMDGLGDEAFKAEMKRIFRSRSGPETSGQ
jgi:tetratricopeptide (TPR) repeat protein